MRQTGYSSEVRGPQQFFLDSLFNWGHGVLKYMVFFFCSALVQYWYFKINLYFHYNHLKANFLVWTFVFYVCMYGYVLCHLEYREQCAHKTHFVYLWGQNAQADLSCIYTL